jgi:hypothetical protein
VAAIEDRADGVRVRFADGAPVATIAAHMRCHLAFARARGFADAGDCPLYMRGAEIALAADGRAVDVTSRDPAVAQAIQVTSRFTSTPQPK